ncbi:MAG: choice-of-anchor Q domain-containing protein [Chloroflexia bacterium]
MTFTHALLPGSPAIDHLPPNDAKCFVTDQRGVARPQGPTCDSGAYEAGGTPPPACDQWFRDVAASNPTCRAITDLFEQGIIQGYFG